MYNNTNNDCDNITYNNGENYNDIENIKHNEIENYYNNGLKQINNKHTKLDCNNSNKNIKNNNNNNKTTKYIITAILLFTIIVINYFLTYFYFEVNNIINICVFNVLPTGILLSLCFKISTIILIFKFIMHTMMLFLIELKILFLSLIYAFNDFIKSLVTQKDNNFEQKKYFSDNV